MPFQFPLATVLRVRLLREEHEERVLQQILQEITRVYAAVLQLDAEVLRVHRERAAQNAAMRAGRDLHLECRDAEQLVRWRKDLEAQIEKREQLKEEQLVRYQAARRDRELLSELHTKQNALYQAALGKREQQGIDDLFAARRLRG